MTIKKRWIDGIKSEADICKAAFPWARGARRREMILRRELDWPPQADGYYLPLTA